jgi:hypothetical protein
MDTYIANFGRGNYLWPEGLRRSTIATRESEVRLVRHNLLLAVAIINW